VQGPLSRFGDTAANEGAMALFDNHPAFKDVPTAIKSIGASVSLSNVDTSMNFSTGCFWQPFFCLARVCMALEPSSQFNHGIDPNRLPLPVSAYF
jgi:hypothetical protein